METKIEVRNLEKQNLPWIVNIEKRLTGVARLIIGKRESSCPKQSGQKDLG